MTAHSMLDQALDHAARGFHVFPLKPMSKIPAIKGWEAAATREPTRVRSWWLARPGDNIAIACGPSGLHVLDLDTGRGASPPSRWAHARDGRDALALLAAEADQPIPVPTYTVSTPSAGGLHLYYRAPRKPPLRNTIARLGWRIDTRGRGGYVVAAGSTLPTGGYRLLDDGTPIPLPEWLIQLLAAPPVPAAHQALAAITHPDAYVEAALTNQSVRVRAARTGTRHHAVLLAANSLGRLVGAGLLDHDHAFAVLLDAARVHCGIDEFTADEAERTITDGLTWAAARTSAADRSRAIRH
ncbi:bifunctional DNA primase/polymerase [Nocardia sp. NPDC052566]|uniref:bifunctional DNA primase/polymerase n=1 Tax=Nocardia sp. NPDC052566 TaxID=3364330 RepID=UPI0037CC2987